MKVSKTNYLDLTHKKKVELVNDLFSQIKGKKLRYALDYKAPVINEASEVKRDHFFGPGASEPVIVIEKYCIDKRTGKKVEFFPHVMTYYGYFEYYSIIN